ncbi:hypothetical protein Strain138_000760 [Pseudogemmatithrix spongiicola]|uniref:Uncharacterized protein n=1 Tax=Pseudogemmatithrix spongiicola TaxID=3062599 RepID=A0AA49JYN0_9BACT|nr:hypothetical protein Strain138_000760 [Gemmatimonadaceae bacterium 'strain 138']WKW14416.1 hypothetical protein Strain318_000760 [Gemmatimonadaceae bacterium 'strain 318']
MSAAVNMLRARPGVLALGAEAPNAITVRVQMPELWDTLAVRCAPDTSVLALKQAALDAFLPVHQPTVDFVMKLRGFEVLDESQPLDVAGARDGSTFLLTYRHRRPVR